MGLRIALLAAAGALALPGCTTIELGTIGGPPSPAAYAGRDARAGRAQGRPYPRQGAFPGEPLRACRAAFPPRRRGPEGRREAWLGLAASYDQLKRFRLADRAYAQALKITGPTAEFLNNRGYSYLLRGDMRRASQDLSAALALDPENERIRNNVRTLDARARGSA